jgi:tRNA (guanine37-N1)-methyltransferase
MRQMRFTILTLFPEVYSNVVTSSIFGRAMLNGLLQVEVINFRDFAEGRHRVVDDAPFGGGAGMVLKVEPIAGAVEHVRSQNPKVRILLLTPQGKVMDQNMVRRLSNFSHLALVCGRYEGVDERVRSLVDEEISIGDYILSGGEPAAWVVMDAVSRLVPGVVGRAESVEEESFSDPGLLEYPQYTRPREFRGQEVPEVLFSGDHASIASWRRQQSLLKTALLRPDLLGKVELSQDERAWLDEHT